MGEIKTERLVLRECRKSDAARISEIANNKNIANNMADVFPYPCALEAAEEWIKFMMEPGQCDKNFVIMFEGEIVGGVGFKVKKGFRRGTASGGYWLGEDYWGNGFATEAWSAMVDYIFENCEDIRRLDVSTFSWNSASHRVLEKCGFTRECCIEDAVVRFGVVGDEIKYGLLLGEWEVLNNRI